MAIFTIVYGNYYPPHGEFKLICIRKVAIRTWVSFTQQYGKNRQRCQQNTFTMLYGNYCYIFIENFSQKFSPCSRSKVWKLLYFYRDEYLKDSGGTGSKFDNRTLNIKMADPMQQIKNLKIVRFFNFWPAILNFKIMLSDLDSTIPKKPK